MRPNSKLENSSLGRTACTRPALNAVHSYIRHLPRPFCRNGMDHACLMGYPPSSSFKPHGPYRTLTHVWTPTLRSLLPLPNTERLDRRRLVPAHSPVITVLSPRRRYHGYSSKPQLREGSVHDSAGSVIIKLSDYMLTSLTFLSTASVRESQCNLFLL